ncbi:MAG: parvulin peptidyl-prolyl isomerase [Calothrix sp. SM1_5_4]|nr:parvulin peptidyl-prolyl isomerase [Calothrix sp. SM1_5_4]
MDVNGKQLTAQAFSKELAHRLKGQDALSAKDPKLVDAMKSKIVEEFLVETLTEEWAKENGVLVKAEDLEQEIRNIQKSYPDDFAFQTALAEEGIGFKDWRARLQGTLLQKMVAQKVVENIAAPTEAEMQAYYQQHRAEFGVSETAQIRQILVATESDAKLMEGELKKGKRLTELAKKYSISPEGPQGGLVGWIEKGQTDVFEPAFRMKTGQRSQVVKSSFGYHIFEVAGRKPAHTRPYNEVKKDIKGILLEKRQQSAYLAWLEEQVRKARVFKDQAFIDAVKVETRIQ